MSSAASAVPAGVQPSAATGKTGQESNKTPYELWCDQFKIVRERTEALGSYPIRGVPRRSDRDDESDGEGEDEDPKKYTQEDMDHVRQIIITKERDAAMKKTRKLVLGAQAEGSVMMFNTSFSYEVLDSFERFKGMHKRAKSWKAKFDLLLGFTDVLNDYDVWMHDHEGGWGGEKMIAGLARMWRSALAKADADLGIDPEFTRPGIVCFLQQFKDTVERIDTYDDPPMKFKFQ